VAVPGVETKHPLPKKLGMGGCVTYCVQIPCVWLELCLCKTPTTKKRCWVVVFSWYGRKTILRSGWTCVFRITPGGLAMVVICSDTCEWIINTPVGAIGYLKKLGFALFGY
jgi:hypothetical protein